MEISLGELLEYLDGNGLVITDDDLLEEALEKIGRSLGDGV